MQLKECRKIIQESICWSLDIISFLDVVPSGTPCSSCSEHKCSQSRKVVFNLFDATVESKWKIRAHYVYSFNFAYLNEEMSWLFDSIHRPTCADSYICILVLLLLILSWCYFKNIFPYIEKLSLYMGTAARNLCICVCNVFTIHHSCYFRLNGPYT
jgi:hypothetical protein